MPTLSWPIVVMVPSLNENVGNASPVRMLRNVDARCQDQLIEWPAPFNRETIIFIEFRESDSGIR